MENIWQDFAKLNGMTNEEFAKEIIITAQAVLAMQLKDNNSNQVRITSTQLGEDFTLLFTKNEVVEIEPLQPEVLNDFLEMAQPEKINANFSMAKIQRYLSISYPQCISLFDHLVKTDMIERVDKSNFKLKG